MSDPCADAYAEGYRDGEDAMQPLIDVAREEERGKLLVQIEELVETLEDVIQQACSGPGDRWKSLDSMALSSYADGIVLLAGYERAEIIEQHGRRVIARWKERE